MLDLKAQLLKAGLVTEAQVEKAESDQQASRASRPEKKKGKGPAGKRPPASEEERWARRVEQLKAAPKSEQYEVIRGWVQRTRIDSPKGLPSDEAERFHFAKHDGHIAWLTLEPAVKKQLSEGEAGIIGFMSHNGLTYCVVPKDAAHDVGKVRPDWVRHLVGFEVETRVPEAPRGAEPASDEPAGDERASDEPARDEPASDEPASEG